MSRQFGQARPSAIASVSPLPSPRTLKFSSGGYLVNLVPFQALQVGDVKAEGLPLLEFLDHCFGTQMS